MDKAIPAIPSIVPESKPERPVFQARWTPPASWLIKAPWSSGWRRAPGTWTADEAPAAVRRTFGPGQVKGARVVVVESGNDTRAQERTPNPPVVNERTE